MIENNIKRFQSKVCNAVLIIASILVLIPAINTFLRALESGWDAIILLSLMTALLIWTITVFRKYITYEIRAGITCTFPFIITAAGLWTYGLLSPSIIWLALLPILITAFFGLRTGIVGLVLCVILIAVLGTLTVSQGRLPPFELESFLVTAPAWLNIGAFVIFASGLSLFITGSLLNYFKTSEERLNNTERLAKIGSWELDLGNNKLHWSDEVYRIFGLVPQEFEATYETFLDNIHPDDRELVNQAYTQSLKNKTAYQIDHRLLLADGTVKYVSEFCESFYDDSGNAVRSIGMVQDITTKKLTEIGNAKLEEQLLHSKKLEAIGSLAGSIAHDFNNILTPIMGYSELTLSQLPDSDPLVDNITSIMKGASRGKELIEQILLFSRKAEGKEISFKLQEVIEESIRFIRVSIPSTVQIQQKIDRSCPNILGDPSQVHQIIVNLCSNALHAMEDTEGVLTIELKQADSREKATEINLIDRKYIKLSIIDTGTGIETKTLDSIFEPFFTTKKAMKGTGLGLSVVQGIVKSHHGEIRVESILGEGTAFHVYLPVAAIDPNTHLEEKEINPVQGGMESILLVDDDIDVGDIIKKMLESLGYKVTFFDNGTDALNSIYQTPEKYDLVISDFNMPGITGADIARELQKLKTSIPIIIVTGYANPISKKTAISSGIDKLINKPIKLNDLASIVKEVLGVNANPNHTKQH